MSSAREARDRAGAGARSRRCARRPLPVVHWVAGWLRRVAGSVQVTCRIEQRAEQAGGKQHERRVEGPHQAKCGDGDLPPAHTAAASITYGCRPACARRGPSPRPIAL
eukprot:scaffold28089_cov52-Phaeocystis_antarctica.AAC.1